MHYRPDLCTTSQCNTMCITTMLTTSVCCLVCMLHRHKSKTFVWPLCLLMLGYKVVRHVFAAIKCMLLNTSCCSSFKRLTKPSASSSKLAAPASTSLIAEGTLPFSFGLHANSVVLFTRAWWSALASEYFGLQRCLTASASILSYSLHRMVAAEPYL